MSHDLHASPIPPTTTTVFTDYLWFNTRQRQEFIRITDQVAAIVSRSGITVLRPLLYYREQEIRELVAKLGLKPIKNPCPYDGHTMRQDIKEHIAALNAQYPEIYEHLAAAMRDSDRQELWPPKPGKELLQKFHTFWRRGKKQAEQ